MKKKKRQLAQWSNRLSSHSLLLVEYCERVSIIFFGYVKFSDSDWQVLSRVNKHGRNLSFRNLECFETVSISYADFHMLIQQRKLSLKTVKLQTTLTSTAVDLASVPNSTTFCMSINLILQTELYYSNCLLSERQATAVYICMRWCRFFWKLLIFFFHF